GGAGGALGALLAGPLIHRHGSGNTWRYTLLAAPLTGIMLPAARPGWGVVLFAAGSAPPATGGTIVNVITRSAPQALCHPGLLGRMSATSRMLSWGVIPLGALAAGALARFFDIRTALWILEFAYFASPALAWSGPLRRIRDLQAPHLSPQSGEPVRREG